MKKINFIAAAAAFMLAFQAAAGAMPIDSVSETDNILKVEGSFGKEYAGCLATVMLMKNDKTAEDIVDAEKPMNAVSNIEIVGLDENGSYMCTLPYSNVNDKVTVVCGDISETRSIEALKKEGIVIYVSPEGDDSSEGTEEGPLKTLDGARKRVREIKNSFPKSPVTVYFLPGEYRFSETVRFDAQADSGSEAGLITYAAKEPGTVIFKGSAVLAPELFRKVDNAEIKARLPISAQDKVWYADMSDAGITDSQVQFRHSYIGSNASSDNAEGCFSPLMLFFNGKKQSVSRWPNVGYNNFEDANGNSQVISDGKATPAKFSFDEVNPLRWDKADYMFIDGYLATCYDGYWKRVTNIDKENKTITLEEGSKITAPYRRWTAVNLLEEIDMPSEFYIDRTDKEHPILYYYPPKNIENGDKIEFSTLYNSMIDMNYVSYVEFRGLGISQNYGDAICGRKCHHVTIDNCSFSNIGSQAVALYETPNVVVKNSTLSGINGAGIYITSGESNEEVSKLIPSGIKILNNHIYNVGFDIRLMGTGTEVYGTRAEVKNNVIHLSNNRAVSVMGADAEISYNELYNLIRDTADAGGIYNGGRWTKYGTDISYNYLHDFGIEKYKDAEHTSAIFLDDTMSGQYVHDNIIINDYISKYKPNDGRYFGSYGVNINGGRDNTVKNNIFAGMDYAVRNTDMTNRENLFEDNESYKSRLNELKEFAETYGSSKLIKKYPQIAENYRDIMSTGKFNPKNIDVTGNVISALQYDSPSGVLMDGRCGGEFADTVTVDNAVEKDLSVFKDAKNHDWRLTDETAEKLNISKNGEFKLLSDFDLSKIGMQGRSMNTGESFSKLYPQNGGVTEHSDKTALYWEQADFADEYEYIVATDAELKNVVSSGTTIYRGTEISGLLPNTKYYWKITAKNISKQALNEINEWDCTDGISSFTTTGRNLYAADAAAEYESEKIKLDVWLQSDTEADETDEFIIARFGENGKLKNLSGTRQNIPSGLNKIQLSVNDEPEEGDYLCLYIWDSISGMKPLINSKIYVR